MRKLNPFCTIPPSAFVRAAALYGTPLYVYDGDLIAEKCREVLSMPSAYGLTARYAMKANPTRAILRLITENGLEIDASSLNEARRAHRAGIGYDKIMLTTQEVPSGADRAELETMMKGGLIYNVCSMNQLRAVAAFAAENGIGLSIRLHPGIGAGESVSRNTGDDYACFGVHLSVLEDVLAFAQRENVRFTRVHTHIGSGGDPEIWRQNIDLELSMTERYFPDATVVNFGGGLKEARMPDEERSDIAALGSYARERVEAFYARTGRRLRTEIEPGTYIVANSGYVVTTVVDKKSTGASGFNFIVADGGMEVNTRPLLYGSRHPFYVVSRDGAVLSGEYDGAAIAALPESVVVGVCCETGDSQCLDEAGEVTPRPLAEPELGDLLIIGGAGGYCSAMAPFNYNSHTQVPEVLARGDALTLIRKRQTMEQMVENEI